MTTLGEFPVPWLIREWRLGKFCVVDASGKPVAYTESLSVARLIADSRSAYPGQGYPWADFLHHRARVLRMWRDEGKSIEEMVADMTMDPGQTRLTLATSRGAYVRCGGCGDKVMLDSGGCITCAKGGD